MRGLALAIAVSILAGCDVARLPLHTTIPARPGDPPAPRLEVSVDDPGGLVRSITAPDPVDTPNAVDVVPGSTNAYRVTWTGGECDAHTTLKIGWGGVRLGISVHSDDAFGTLACSGVGIRRQVVLVLNQFVPSTQFSLDQEP
jgi:hypothetical protein